MKFFQYLFTSLILLSLVPFVSAASVVTNFQEGASQVGQYQKYESTFQISRSFSTDSFLPYYYYDPNDTPANDPNRNAPYGVEGITIDAHITSPSGEQITLPAFYHQQYNRTGNASYSPTNNFSWKIRFAPEEIGTYTYYISIQDKNGTSRYPQSGTISFTSVASTSKGFVRTSPRDSRFLEYSNGTSFIPIGSGHQWWRCCGIRVSDYEQTFNEFGAHGINFVRIWDQNDGYALTVESRYDAYSWPDDYNPEDNGVNIGALRKGTQMNQRGNFEEDLILEAAEQNGVKIVLSSHEDIYWTWHTNGEDYNNPFYRDYWKRNYRYRIARWGYSTSVLAWERWNEHGHIPAGSQAYSFYQDFSTYVDSIDPYDHLFTTSQGSQAYSPALYSLPNIDYVSYHDYLMSSRYSSDLEGDTTNFLYRAAQCLRSPGQSGCFFGDGSGWSGPQKPIFWGEFDSGTTQWNQPNPNPLVQHNGLWAGLFSNAGSSPLDWYWESQNYLAQKYDDALIASNFFADIDYAGLQFDHQSTSDVRINNNTLSASHAKMRVLALKAANNMEAYAWVQHKDHRWKGSLNPSAISGSFTLNSMQNGTYNLEYWNTTTGGKNTSTVTATNNQLVIPVNNLSTDIALKIRHTNRPDPTPTPTSSTNPSPTPTPTPTSSTQTPCQQADINQDGIVDLTDYSLLATNFLSTNPSVPRADINSDGIVDLTDYSLLAVQFLQICS